MQRILVLNGPNLNLLGSREPEIYGRQTLDDIHGRLQQRAEEAGYALDFFQSNAEHQLIDQVHHARGNGTRFILVNAAAYTHTSIALRDALVACEIRFIELHLSNVFAREPFRHLSLLSDKALGVITGFGAYSYLLALDAALFHLQHKD